MRKTIAILSTLVVLLVAVIVIIVVGVRKQREDVVEQYMQYESFEHPVIMPDKEESPVVPLEEMEMSQLDKYQQMYDEVMNK